MKLLAFSTLAAALLAPQLLHAQASDIPSAAPVSANGGGSSEERGLRLLDQMVAALGGDAWLHRTSLQLDGRTSSFFHGEPNPYIVEYHTLFRFAASGQPDAERLGFLTDRGMIMPGKKVDVVQIWKEGHGYEVTFKGQTELPKEQVDDYYRRKAHSIEEVVKNWIHAPGVMILGGGSTMVGRHITDKITILTAQNDAVTLELDASSHLPLRRTFQWRNPQFNDFDEEVEEYDDYHTFQGLPTAMTITRYHNGDMTNQRYFTKVTYNVPVPLELFDPSNLVKKK
ncbi:MAG TPA: hypothetical protein VGN01_17595 [Acidobacteriaceae bacterium]|jgi:hypothetical protein